MSPGPQKPDHGGNFYMTPRRAQRSVAWRNLSLRARAVLQVFQSRHNGFNNGHLSIAIHDIAKEIGGQNHGANGRAVAELIEKGFLEITAEADRRQGKVREYRITFIATGTSKELVPATHEYADWRPSPGAKRKFGGAKAAPEKPVSGAETTTERKIPGASSAPDASTSDPNLTGKRETCSSGSSAIPALHIDNHSPVGSDDRKCLSKIDSLLARDRLTLVDLDELRGWARAVVASGGYGRQRKLCREAGIPEPILSRFRGGGSLPEHYRFKLQEACGRYLPHDQWKPMVA